MKLSAKLKIKNSLGLHTRPATVIAKLLQASLSQVMFHYKGDTVNAKSIMSLLMLAAPKNAVITVTVSGEDAEVTMLQLKEVFENRFGECI
ncbi:MAG: HPr family phosphocarrier protein [Rhabdochlamydiaceae bacterium]